MKIAVELMHLFSLRPEEFLHDCPYFALWSLDPVISMTSPNLILDILVHERSLSRGVPPSYPPPEQFFNPSTYNFGRYFTAFHLNCDKLQWRSNATQWFSFLLTVCHTKTKTKKPPKPSQTWLPCPNKVLPPVEHIWQAVEFCVWGLL